MLAGAPGSRPPPPVERTVWLAAAAALLWSCSGGGTGSGGGANPRPLIITTTSLPDGQVGHAYSTALVASGGTPPLSWTLTGGALPAGLTLNSATGAISGTPGSATAGTMLTFTVSDTASQKYSVGLKLVVSPAVITVAVSPARGGITVSQTLTLSASTNDYAGLRWRVTPAAGGTISPASSSNGGNVTFTPASTAGAYTVTATSVTESSVAASVPVGVTDLAGVYTYHNDLARDGANIKEFALTPATVSTATFGKLFSCTVDGAVYAQPLWVAHLTIGAASHNVVYVATQHDSLYAFDADASPCVQLWKVSLIDAAHGAAVPENSVPSGVVGFLVGDGTGSDIAPEVGVTSTPVIDPVSRILYVVSKSVESGTTTIHQRLHAIDLFTGSEKTGSPVTLQATDQGVAYDPKQQNQRAGLALVNGTVYVASGSHDDTPQWFGWILGYTYSGAAFTPTSALNVAPTTGGGGIWMSGGAPSADGNGNLYVTTGNLAPGAATPSPDYCDAFLQLTPALAIQSWFAPTSQPSDDANNNDFSAGGSAIVLNLSSGMLRHLVIGGGKDGVLYLLNGDQMGNSVADANARQHFSVGNMIFATSAFWNNTIYLAPVGTPMLAYAFDPVQDKFLPAAAPAPSSQSAAAFGFPGSTPSISASGPATAGILWGLDSSPYCTSPAPGCGPAVLHAYDATNLATELWNSSKVAADAAGYAVKFTVPTVANGKVYVGTRGNDPGPGAASAPTVPGELDVYGLKPN
jgi:Putative Ig domain